MENAFTSPEEYLEFAKKFYQLTDQQISKFEDKMINGVELNNIVNALPSLISLVNTVGYLRGQDGVFLDIRPAVGENQKILYQMEDEMEARLKKLIDYIKESEYRDYYGQLLEKYFIKTRT